MLISGANSKANLFAVFAQRGLFVKDAEGISTDFVKNNPNAEISSQVADQIWGGAVDVIMQMLGFSGLGLLYYSYIKHRSAGRLLSCNNSDKLRSTCKGNWSEYRQFKNHLYFCIGFIGLALIIAEIALTAHLFPWFRWVLFKSWNIKLEGEIGNDALSFPDNEVKIIAWLKFINQNSTFLFAPLKGIMGLGIFRYQ